MAYTPCPTASVTKNAVRDCDNPAVEGLQAVAVAVAVKDIASIVRGTGAEKNKVSAITLNTSAKTFVIEAAGETPFASTTESFDAATKRFNKTVTFVAPAHGAGFSAGLIEPLMTDRDGFVVILQRKHRNGDWSFPIIGLERGAVGATAELDYNETSTAGCYTLALTETGAASSEIDLFDTDFETTKGLFDKLLGQSL